MNNAIAAAFLTNAAAHAEGKRKVVDLLVRDLAEVMRDIHGGDWFMNINHEGRMVMIFEAGDDQPVLPKRGEAV